MELLVPRISELIPALFSLAVLLTIVGGSIYLILLLRRSVRAQERLAEHASRTSGGSAD